MRERQPLGFGNAESAPSPETPTPDFVFYAGTSHRREHFLKFCFPNSTVISIPPGPERRTHEVDQIMIDKIDAVLPQARTRMLKNPGQTGIVVAADTESFPLTLENGRPTNLGKGKPENVSEVRDTFQLMYEAARRMSEGWGEEVNPYYYVNASSGVRDLQTGDLIPKHHGCIIELDSEVIKNLGTVRGFNKYAGEFSRFFSSPRYLYNGNHPPIKITDVAGGIDIGVMSRLGAVVGVDSVKRHDAGFREQLSYVINHSTVGIHATVLRKFNPGVSERINNWPWLQKVTDYAMGID